MTEDPIELKSQTCFEEVQEKRKKFYANLSMVDNLLNQSYLEKLERSRLMVKDAMAFYDGQIAVACSFGKDSTVVLHLALQEDPTIPVVFANTGVEMKETIEFKKLVVEKWGLNYHELIPETTFWTCVERFGYPGIRYGGGSIPRCCYHLKKKPMRGLVRENDLRALFLGLTAPESRQRKFTAARYGDHYITEKSMPWPIHKFNPIMFWTDKDVWRYIINERLPYNKAYEKVDRVGCVPCTGYITWEKQMSKLKPKLYEKIKREMLGVPQRIDDY